MGTMGPRELLAHNIRATARRRGIGLNSLADFAGVARSQLFAVLACRSSASLDWIARVADALEIEAWRLLRPPAKPGRKRR